MQPASDFVGCVPLSRPPQSTHEKGGGPGLLGWNGADLDRACIAMFRMHRVLAPRCTHGIIERIGDDRLGPILEPPTKQQEVELIDHRTRRVAAWPPGQIAVRAWTIRVARGTAATCAESVLAVIEAIPNERGCCQHANRRIARRTGPCAGLACLTHRRSRSGK